MSSPLGAIDAQALEVDSNFEDFKTWLKPIVEARSAIRSQSSTVKPCKPQERNDIVILTTKCEALKEYQEEQHHRLDHLNVDLRTLLGQFEDVLMRAITELAARKNTPDEVKSSPHVLHTSKHDHAIIFGVTRRDTALVFLHIICFIVVKTIYDHCWFSSASAAL